MNIPAAIDLIQKYGEVLEVPEIRVWCHPNRIGEDGDDYYHTFDTFEQALKFIESNPEIAETVPLLAFRGYEINIFAVEKAFRLPE